VAGDLLPGPGEPVVLVLIGVAGCGKSTVAGVLAGWTGWPFAEGDALHPPGNVAKMASGHALGDADRLPWLERIADWTQSRLDAGGSGIITCSALKRSCRRIISRGRDTRRRDAGTGSVLDRSWIGPARSSSAVSCP
jgi:carbohydrate kinase (thermoresistant glucokinase family)